jgi:hypothetical protein
MSPDAATPEMDNVYIERDDQGWGGYGGIERVALTRDSLTLRLSARMAKKMGGYDSVRLCFSVSETVFLKLRHVLGLILRGYESRMDALAEQGAAADRGNGD